MNLLIHDLDEKRWEEVKSEYEGWSIVSDNGQIRPCSGCFSCWNKTPGECIIKDGYQNMGYIIHHSEEVVVISRYTYGGFSGFVKNVFDRCLGYVLPQFEVVNGESHHQKRYAEDKPFTFIFYGNNLSEDDKKKAERYVKAVCTNIRGCVKNVEFREDKEERKTNPRTGSCSSKTVILNASMRYSTGNSFAFSEKLNALLEGKTETYNLCRYLNDLPSLVGNLSDCDRLVICTPLYVDGLPSQLIRLFECFEKEYRGSDKKVYLLANMGLYESRQFVNMFNAVKKWCKVMNFEYGGGLGISAGELLGVLIQKLPFEAGPCQNAYNGIRHLAETVNKKKVQSDEFAEPNAFPRSLYIGIANTNWRITAKRNGIRPSDLYRKL
ncbi:MAG: flavodoxin family protein [Erysipelotrichaceae bacterium]|nr:flavodoxin family protein [Erysipelotrichaceae bacterium]